ncbi:putative peptidase family m20 protein [Rosellinia necatrix]|uniref:Putative peptidase family m20 protein n=1 Tax=Rosellinia necatrix TaxID=77044 RepID=A0A1S7UI07_ROSNE|nr:putative peptidase family m20 protein [Rosellinia necatrix]
MAAKTDAGEVVELLKTLMNIESTSEQELEIGQYLEQYIRGRGFSAERIAIAPGSTRHNVYAYLGRGREARLLVTAHMDTVPPHIPFSLDEGGDVVRGRGACDDLGPMVAQIFAVEELRAEGRLRDGDVSFLWVVGEEKGGPGMIAANDMGLTWEAGLFAEPTEGKIAKGHKGNLVFEVVAHGKACHSGYPHLGRSATELLFDAMNDLRTTEWPVSDLLGPSTLNIGKIEGGAGYNILAAEAKALCSIRVSKDIEGIKDKVRGVIDKHPDVEVDFKFQYPEMLLQWEFEGFKAEPMAYGTDIPRLRGDHKKVLYGPGSIRVAHGKDEYVRVSEIMESIEKNKQLILELLK